MNEKQAKEFAKKVYEERKKKVEEEKTKKENEIYQHVMNIMEMFSYSTKEEPRIRTIGLVPQFKGEKYLQIRVRGEEGEVLEQEELSKAIAEAIEKTEIPQELRLEICKYFQKNLSAYFVTEVITGIVDIHLKKDITICEKEEAEE